MPRSSLFTTVVLLVLGGCADTRAPGADDGAAAVPLYDDLGDHHYAITTSVPEAQEYFDQGLRLTYAFNHSEAIRSFTEGARLDPDCAMCYWGIAYALGPNINAPMDSAAGAEAYSAVQMAQERAGDVDDRETALIEALALRYAPVPPAERASLDSAYADAMGEATRRFPDDNEVAALYAEALMDLSPWDYWNPDGSARPATPEITATLERVIARDANHPGACHFYIHALEAVEPERAVPCAERLAGLMPGAGHLVHMPGHIYIRVGRYRDAIEANEHAVHADETYIRDQQPGLGTYVLGYYPHNYDFLAFAATLAGQGDQALDAARAVASLVPEEMLREPGMESLQHFWTGHLRLLVRFGRWDEILAMPAPPEDLPYPRAIWHYAHGMASAARGNLDAAEADLAELRGAADDPAFAEMSVGFNPASEILGIASKVLAGEIAGQRGDHDAAVTHLREAAEQEDALVYGEPPDWPIPVRHNLGAALLAAGRPAEAEQVYREDLERFPENGWSLFGLASSLRAQERGDEAVEVERRFAAAWEGTDLNIGSSKY